MPSRRFEKGAGGMIPDGPGDINASQQGQLEIAEYFFRRKSGPKDRRVRKKEAESEASKKEETP
ncbi:MAG: hypothetical protein K6T66_05235 [Peptococcaceae bacterium]|nr:hypothetical protein [Peptococcaceae bacterium]